MAPRLPDMPDMPDIWVGFWGGGGGGGCAAAWNNATAYVSGNEVSYNGDSWIANQWNYDEVPGGPSGAWNNAGACWRPGGYFPC
jgi:carbohydrate binding protein with CBM5/12 domain